MGPAGMKGRFVRRTSTDAKKRRHVNYVAQVFEGGVAQLLVMRPAATGYDLFPAEPRTNAGE